MQRAFLSAVKLPWEAFADEANLLIRHSFMQIHHSRSQELVKGSNSGNFLPASDSWQLCADGLGQFQYLTYEQNACDGCRRVFPQSPSERPSKRRTLDLEGSSGHGLKNVARASIAECSRRQFAPRISQYPRFGRHGLPGQDWLFLGTCHTGWLCQPRHSQLGDAAEEHGMTQASLARRPTKSGFNS